MTRLPSDPLLTLEPLVEAVREGVEAVGWELSGLQKTTSHQFEGRWAGDSSRSAYLFFHRPDGLEWASVDVFLDETTKGLSGNLALVVDARELEGLGAASEVLETLGALAHRALPEGYRTPLTLRLRLDDGRDRPGSAEAELRFKLRIPRSAVEAGAPAVIALSRVTVQAFETIMSDTQLHRYL